MYILKNAWLSITRNKGRNILIGIIIMVIGAACTVALSIRSSANTLVKAYEEKYSIEATISFNRENLMKNFTPGEDNAEDNIDIFNNITNISINDINSYGDSNYVDYYYYTYSVGMNGSGITPASQELEKVTTETTTTKSWGGGRAPFNRSTTTTKSEEIRNMRGTNGDFTVIGYSSYEGMVDFINGNYTIADGEVNSDFNSYNCVINKELASLNEIEVGDTITLVNNNNSNLTYDLIVTGIYTDSSENSINMKSMFSNSANNIITNTTVIEKILNDDESISSTIMPTFVLNNKNVVNKFASEVEEKGLDENYQVSNNLNEIESEIKPISNVSNFALTFLIVTLVIGGIVLFVINMINVRERKYEIGVLRTIGMSKFKVISEFVIEICVVAFVALVLGAGIGSTCSISVANSLLANEISESIEQSNKIKNNFGGMNKPNDIEINEPNKENDSSNEIEKEEKSEIDNSIKNGIVKINKITDINAVVNIKVLLELLGIGIGLILLSSLSSMISISRFSPLNILKERS